MTKTFPEVISGIRTAKKGVEVREDIAQMGEYVEQFAATATQKAEAAAASEKKHPMLWQTSTSRKRTLWPLSSKPRLRPPRPSPRQKTLH